MHGPGHHGGAGREGKGRAAVVRRDRAAGVRLITKGAFSQVLDVCARDARGGELTAASRAELIARHEQWSAQGLRVLAIATAAVPDAASYGRSDEREMSFSGFVTFLDRPRTDAVGGSPRSAA